MTPIVDEGWLELAEILPPSVLETLLPSSEPSSSSSGRNHTARALLLTPSSSENDDLASVVLQGVAGPLGPSTDSSDEVEAPSDGVVFVHPILFMFLHLCVKMTSVTLRHSSDELADETVPTKSVANLSIVNQYGIAPLPMLEYQYFLQQHQLDQCSSEQPTFWNIHPVNVVDLPDGSRISLTCVYVEDEDWLLEWADPCRRTDEIITIALQGRLIHAQSVVLLSTLYGCVIAKVTKMEIASGSEWEGGTGMAYRVATRTAYQFHIDAPPMVPSMDADLSENSSTEGAEQDGDIPGYESLSKELLDLFSVHGSPAAASGILLVGCAGVGKSRMASFLVHHYRQFEHNKSQQFKSCYLSVQDLIFQSSVEADLLKNVLIPKLRDCQLWVIDDLHLLETPVGSGDETRRDVEYMMVQNALIGAIDRFHKKCRILGIAQSESNLPVEITKVGRLEKTIQMLPPTQAQRIEIWKSCFEREEMADPLTIPKWTLALASSTSGFVASDILRVYQDAKIRCWARRRREASSDDDDRLLLEWMDLREAAKSIVPSQLAELDVLKPVTFAAGMSWREIHEQSWKDFGGYDSIKKHAFRHVVSPWRHFLQRLDETPGTNDALNMPWLEPPPGVLFFGPSGTGKTMAATCLAASLELPMIQVRATDILDKWLGGSEALLRSLFARARAVSPCILFLDEIDSLAANREEDETNDFTSRILSTLLNEMDGVSSAIQTSRVLVIACTNRIESLDSALLRPGRLQEHFAMDLPAPQDLEDILRLRFQKIPVDSTLNLSDVARVLFGVGATGADAEGLCSEVCMISLRRSLSLHDLHVTRDDFDLAVQERFRVIPK